MPLSEKALAQFVSTSQRSQDLANLYVSLRTSHSPPNNVDDVMRAAVVLQVASMDAYFTRKFIDVLMPYLRSHGPNTRIIKLLSEAGLNTEQALVMATMDRPFRRIRTLITSHLETYTTQRFRAIDELFVCFGVKDLSQHAQASIHRKSLLRRITALVKRRHAIVHAGDIQKGGKLSPINAKQLLGRMEAVLLFVQAADDLIGKAIKI